MERGRIQGLPKFFWVTPIISGRGKATNFKFCTHILSIDRNKSPLQISGKVAGCVVRTLETFQGTHILGASRGLLCDSSAVLFPRGLSHLCPKNNGSSYSVYACAARISFSICSLYRVGRFCQKVEKLVFSW